MSLGSRRLHSPPRLQFTCGFVATLNLLRLAGSIDSLAPARSPFGLRPWRSAPAGSTPAPTSTKYSRPNKSLAVSSTDAPPAPTQRYFQFFPRAPPLSLRVGLLCPAGNPGPRLF